MSRARISVIMPVFNGQRYLAEALDSALGQAGAPPEVIVVDDGSTDATPSVLETYSGRITHLRREHGGVSAARNLGLAHAAGELIAFLDADDRFLPGKLKAQAQMLAENADLDYVHSGFQRIDANGRLLASVQPWLSSPGLALEDWLTHGQNSLWCILFRRACFEQVGGFDESLAQSEDVDFLLRLALAGFKGGWLQQPTVQYRAHPLGLTRDDAQAVACYNQVMMRFFARPDLPENARSLERKVRFNNLAYCIHRLYRAGLSADTEPYLRQALGYAHPHPPAAALLVMRQLALLEEGSHGAAVDGAAGDGQTADGLAGLLPQFRSACGLGVAAWDALESLLKQQLAGGARRAAQ